MRTTPTLATAGLLVLGLLALTPNASAGDCIEPNGDVSPTGCVNEVWHPTGENIWFRVYGDATALCRHYLGDCPLPTID